MFGQIAAANSLSDIYAMGGVPKLALNIVGFPNCLNPEILGDILKGGADKVKESEAVLIGGHSIQNEEPLYGLSVTGFINPSRVYTNCGAKPGDVLILTKQIGSGIINTAIKADLASSNSIKEAEKVMSSLNKKAGEVALKHTVHACTDITGFGLVGHAAEMAVPGNLSFEIDYRKINYFEELEDFAKMGLVPAGAYKNREYNSKYVEFKDCPEHIVDALFDPQTSGGLLLSVPESELDYIMDDFIKANMDTKVSVIGRVHEKEENSKNIIVS